MTQVNYDYDNIKKRNLNNQKFKNISMVIDNLLKDYDIRLRPNFGGKPLNVDMEIRIASFDAISEVNMVFTVQFFHLINIIFKQL